MVYLYVHTQTHILSEILTEEMVTSAIILGSLALLYLYL